MRPIVIAGTLLSLSTFALAQDKATITLAVDATDAPRRILHAKLAIPAAPGPLTLRYPKWLPGEHGPTGPLVDLAGVKITAGGKPVPWTRDLLEMFALHCDVPAGASSIDVTLDYLAPTSKSGFTEGASTTSKLVMVSWNTLLLYPGDAKSADLTYRASLKLPAGWKHAGALPVARDGETVEFAPVSLETLVDSPVLSGEFMRTFDLTAPSGGKCELHVAADSQAALEMPAETEKAYKHLVAEAEALFGAHHYESYHFLLTLSDHVPSFGLEHHESSDDRLKERSLVDEDLRKASSGLLPHEYVHSWNGKYRRPAGLATGDFHTPMRTDLLWVYEGLTEYLGYVLTARSGLETPEVARQDLALVAAAMEQSRGRAWRPLQDTADEAQILYYAPDGWSAWRRGVDFYDEGTLLWLEVDTIIRTRSKGARSLDDFCKRFHGGKSGRPQVVPYTLDDVVKTLNEVEPYDWKALLMTRVTATDPAPPFKGVEASGWKLGYGTERGDLQKAYEERRESVDEASSIGIHLDSEGTIDDVVPGRAAADAGVGPGMRLVAVNGRAYKKEVLRDAIKASKTAGSIDLLVESADYFKTFHLVYKDGARFPLLERGAGQPDLLSDILRPRTWKPEAAKK
ncbi:MAG: M61 family peptidase [Acidobacteriota bacterium]